VKKRRPKSKEPRSEQGDISHRPFAELARQRLRNNIAPRAAKPPPAVEAPPACEPESFAALLGGVVPLAASPRVPEPPRGAPSRALRTADESVRFETSDDGAHLEGRRLDVDPKELRRLRRGLFVVDATLDLHGRSAPEARAELAKFVRLHALAGERLVLVIHGRGNHSPGGQAVLRGEIGAWLSQGAAARYVAAFVTAPPEQGGEGAVLVLLDRSRG
jgi:DNA-nicking Smr family endonuclease